MWSGGFCIYHLATSQSQSGFNAKYVSTYQDFVLRCNRNDQMRSCLKERCFNLVGPMKTGSVHCQMCCHVN